MKKTKTVNGTKNILRKIWWKQLWQICSRFIAYICLILVCGVILWIAVIPNKGAKKRVENAIYRNEKLVIVGTNEAAQDFSHDKFHKPIIIKVWLVQRVSDTTQFAELTSNCDYYKNFYITKELWYTKGIGDTLYFDYILKRRFFTIKK